MRRSGNKVLIIVLIVIAVLAIVGGIFAYIFFATDMLKSGQQLFAKYLVQNFTELSQAVPMDKITEIDNKLKQNKYEETMTMSYTESGKVQPDSLVTMETQVDYVNKKSYADLTLLAEELQEELELEFMQNMDTYSLRFTNSVKQFLSIENSSLKQLAINMGVDEETLEMIPDKIDFEQFSLDKLKLTEEEIKKEISKYAMVLYNNIPKENYEKSKDTVITVNGKTITTNSYALTITSQDIKNIAIKFLETAKEDEIILAKLQIVDEMLQDYEVDSLKDAFVSGIDEILSEASKEENQETEQGSNIKIIVYEEKGKTVRIKLEKELDYITIDTTEVDGKKQIDINSISMDEDNTQLSNGFKIIKESDSKAIIQINDIYGEEQTITSLSIELVENENNTKLSFTYDDEDGQMLIVRDINWVEEIDYKVNLDSSNNILLNELSEDQMTNIFNALEPTLTSEYSEPMEWVDTAILIPAMMALPLQTGDIPLILPISIGITIYNTAAEVVENVDFSEAELEAFNGKFQVYEGSNQTANDVNALIYMVRSHNSSEKSFETNRYVTISGDVILGVDGTETSRASTGYYDVICLKNEQGRIYEIVVTKLESDEGTFIIEDITPSTTDEGMENIVNMGENIFNSLN